MNSIISSVAQLPTPPDIGSASIGDVLRVVSLNMKLSVSWTPFPINIETFNTAPRALEGLNSQTSTHKFIQALTVQKQPAVLVVEMIDRRVSGTSFQPLLRRTY
jgi:hypothetical protein